VKRAGGDAVARVVERRGTGHGPRTAGANDGGKRSIKYISTVIFFDDGRMTASLGPGGLLRGALDAIDAGIIAAVADLQLPGYRPRFSGIVRTIARDGPSTINDLAVATQVSQSAASQTVSEMRVQGLVKLARGEDERQRIVSLSDAALALLPAIEAEWTATTAALSALDAELSVPLSTTIEELSAALDRRSFRQRIADAAEALPPAVSADYRCALAGGRNDAGVVPTPSAQGPRRS
jgi:DNA-binding MarR family transcriptional regulator